METINLEGILDSLEGGSDTTETSSIIHREIIDIAQKVYESIGVGHSEFIYQRALAIELRCSGYLIETEKRVLITYIDVFDNKHHLGDERIDIYIHKNSKINYEVIIELKQNVNQPKQSEIEQVLKYKRELEKDYIKPEWGIVINFPQAGAKLARDKVDYVEIKL